MFLFASGFYVNADKIFSIVKDLEFARMPYGLEVEKFQMLSAEVADGFGFLLSRRVKFSPASGAFRVPYPVIHFEEPCEGQIFSAAVALAETKFCLHRHLETGFTTALEVGENLKGFVADNCFDKSKWEIYSTVKMMPNDVVVYKPLIWHSFEGGMIKWFGLEAEDARL